MRADISVQPDPHLHRDPAVVQRVFAGTRLAPLWVLPRAYVGWVWMSVGWSMLQSRAWTQDGSPLADAWAPGTESNHIVAGLNLTGPIVDTGLLVWVARFTALGLTIAGIAVILGVATGFAAFIGVILSVNVLTTGAMSPGPDVFGLAMLLIVAWKTAGWIGLDRWLLPFAGAPWSSGFSLRSTSGVLRQTAD